MPPWEEVESLKRCELHSEPHPSWFYAVFHLFFPLWLVQMLGLGRALAGRGRQIAIFRSPQGCLFGFKWGLWLGVSTVTQLSLRHFCLSVSGLVSGLKARSGGSRSGFYQEIIGVIQCSLKHWALKTARRHMLFFWSSAGATKGSCVSGIWQQCSNMWKKFWKHPSCSSKFGPGFLSLLS